mmetsp:Transcript_44554/g.133220  ORF Transcript_44554/g.133220 Transcript_44554/m.133220 type:complete len:220 (+) Transcript_44554:1386-2045(+)
MLPWQQQPAGRLSASVTQEAAPQCRCGGSSPASPWRQLVQRLVGSRPPLLLWLLLQLQVGDGLVELPDLNRVLCRLALQPLHLCVGKHAKEREARANAVLRGHRVVEEEDGGNDNNAALDAVADGVRHRGYPLQNHVADLLVGAPAYRRKEDLLPEEPRERDASCLKRARRICPALHRELERQQDEEREHSDDAEHGHVVEVLPHLLGRHHQLFAEHVA